MDKQKQEEEELRSLMKHARLTVPLSDFEELVMHRIAVNQTGQAGISRDRAISFSFFVLGTLAGILLTVLLGRMPTTLAAVPKEWVTLIFQFMFVMLFLIQLDKNLPLLRRRKKSYTV